MKKAKKTVAVIFSICLFCILPAITGIASELNKETDANEIQNDLLGRYDFNEIDDSLKELFPEEKLDFKETLSDLISGDTEPTAQMLNRLVSEQLSYAYTSCRTNLIHILFIAVIAAVFTNFAHVFQGKQIAEISFYMLYLLLIALCLNSFQVVLEWVSSGIEGLTGFMSAFCPLYFIAVAVAKGSATAVAFYNFVLFLIYFVELFIAKVLIPVINIYIMIKVLNFLSPEEYLSKFAELVETVVKWTLKSLLAFVIGLNVVQGLISPAIDTVKQSAVTRTAEAIPGIGDAIGGMTEVVLGTAILVKNGIGVMGMVICFAVCLVPLIQTGLTVLMYKLAAAMLQPISDKRIIGCIESVSDGCRMMMRVIFTTGLLFLITIVITAALTMST